MSLIDRHGGWFLRRWGASKVAGVALLLLLYVPLAACAPDVATAAAAGLALIGAVVTLGPQT